MSRSDRDPVAQARPLRAWLLPPSACNDGRGSRVAVWGFALLTVVMTGRSLVHLLKRDSGVNSIATIVPFAGNPDPDRVIHMYSALWGSQQLVTATIYAIVVLRYRNLVPLMWLLFAFEIVLRMGVGGLHPLGPDYFLRTPPGKVGNLPMLLLALSMLGLSLRAERRANAA